MTPKTLLTKARFIRSFTNWLMAGESASYPGIDSSYFDVEHILFNAYHYLDTSLRRFAKREIDYLKVSLRARSAVIGASTHVLHGTEGEPVEPVAGEPRSASGFQHQPKKRYRPPSEK